MRSRSPRTGLLAATAATVQWLGVCLLAPALAEPAELREPVEWLRGYLRQPTVSGGEGRGAAFLANLLHHEGVPTQRFVSPNGRTSLLARLEGLDATAGSLVLLHHIDVVAATAASWRHEPFAGLLVEGRIWGRGAVDIKSLGIAHLAAFLELHRTGVQLRRDVVFLAVADEERGGAEGTRWLLERHAEEIGKVGLVLGEGGINRVARDHLFWWGLEVAQKTPLWLEITVEGPAGHGSTPMPGNATHRLLRALNEVIDRQRGPSLTAESLQYLRALGTWRSEEYRRLFSPPSLAKTQAALERAQADGRLVRLISPGLQSLLYDSVQVTGLHAGDHTINVVPERATATVDARLLPSTDPESLVREIEAALGAKARIEVLLRSEPSPATPLEQGLQRILVERLTSDAPVVPLFISGTTDSRYFRQRGIAAIGFSPFLLGPLDTRGIHGHDESIDHQRFLDGVERMKDLVDALATTGDEP